MPGLTPPRHISTLPQNCQSVTATIDSRFGVIGPRISPMHDGNTEVAGLVVPSTSPVFLTLVGIHVILGLAAVIAGGLAMFARKQKGGHVKSGTVYFWALTATFATASALSFMRWAENYPVFIVGVCAFVCVFVGRRARRGGWNNSLRVHVTGMGLSYILLLTAFYVETGSQLPLWRLLPPLAFWLLPTTIGLPVIVLTLFLHPLLRRRSS